MPTHLHHVRSQLTKLSLLDALIADTKARQQNKITAIQAATGQVLGPKVAERKQLEADLKLYIDTHREELLGSAKTLDLDTHVIAYRSSMVVEIEDEAQVIASLESMVEDPSATVEDRMSANACLRRPDTEIDKTFINKSWGKFSAWFLGFGIAKVRRETLSIKATKTPEVEA
jgi:phage host-nuclease inhibitor protein Gam